MDAQAEYELREARSEIGRYHALIVELKDGLDWALSYIAFACPDLPDGDQERYTRFTQLLNRQVS